MSSPQPGISPTFDQFPVPPTQEPPKPPHRLSPHAKVGLARSNTSPAMLHSPLSQTFDSPLPIKEQASSPNDKPSSYNHLRDPVKGNAKGKITIATLAKTRGQQTAPKGIRFDPEVSSLVLESPTESEGGWTGSEKSPELIQAEPIQSSVQRAPEPKWEMVSPSSVSQQAPSSTAPSSLSSRKGSPSVSSASAKTSTTLPLSQSSVHDDLDPPSERPTPTSTTSTPTTAAAGTAATNDDNDDDDDIVITSDMNPVEVSIARQISLSRQQRRMLRPLQTGGRSTPRPPRDNPSRAGSITTSPKTGGGGGGGGGGGNSSPSSKQQQQGSAAPPLARTGTGRSERLAETKSSTPTLIVPPDSQLSQNRKSERVILEAA